MTGASALEFGAVIVSGAVLIANPPLKQVPHTRITNGSIIMILSKITVVMSPLLSSLLLTKSVQGPHGAYAVCTIYCFFIFGHTTDSRLFKLAVPVA